MRLTNTMREKMIAQVLQNVPAIDYSALLTPVVQKVFYKHLPPSVQLIYDDETIRPHLVLTEVSVRDGTSYGSQQLWLRTADGKRAEFPTTRIPRQYHSEYEININSDRYNHLRPGTLQADLVKAVRKTGYFEKHEEQNQLRADVKKRLEATLQGASSTQKLYEVLEPELHYLIPAEADVTANLPAKAGPVVSDLLKLGAKLPPLPTNYKTA